MSSGAGNPPQDEEESSGIPFGVSRVSSGNSGNHLHAFFTVIFKDMCEARPCLDAVMDDGDEMIDYVCPHLTHEQAIEANESYELRLTLDADMGVARTTVAELLLPHNLGTTGVHHAQRDMLDLRSHERGKMCDFLNAADRIKGDQ